MIKNELHLPVGRPKKTEYWKNSQTEEWALIAKKSYDKLSKRAYTYKSK